RAATDHRTSPLSASSCGCVSNVATADPAGIPEFLSARRPPDPVSTSHTPRPTTPRPARDSGFPGFRAATTELRLPDDERPGGDCGRRPDHGPIAARPTGGNR